MSCYSCELVAACVARSARGVFSQQQKDYARKVPWVEPETSHSQDLIIGVASICGTVIQMLGPLLSKRASEVIELDLGDGYTCREFAQFVSSKLDEADINWDNDVLATITSKHIDHLDAILGRDGPAMDHYYKNGELIVDGTVTLFSGSQLPLELAIMIPKIVGLAFVYMNMLNSKEKVVQGILPKALYRIYQLVVHMRVTCQQSPSPFAMESRPLPGKCDGLLDGMVNCGLDLERSIQNIGLVSTQEAVAAAYQSATALNVEEFVLVFPPPLSYPPPLGGLSPFSSSSFSTCSSSSRFSSLLFPLLSLPSSPFLSLPLRAWLKCSFFDEIALPA